MADEQFKVTSPDGKKTLFQGLEDAARKFIENNFPRLHATPGSNYGDEGPQPDVQLLRPDGKSETFHADQGWIAPPADPEPEPEPASVQTSGSVPVVDPFLPPVETGETDAHIG